MQTKKPTKPWYQSKTLWLNFLAAVLVALETNFHLLQSSIGDHAYVAISSVLAGANVVLRMVTTEGIHFRSQQ